MDENTSFVAKFDKRQLPRDEPTTYGLNWSSDSRFKVAPRTKVRSWTVFSDSLATKFYISGRVSADNRWPLGFQIEPFDFKTAKVGQKLKFKQFPVPLPQP